MSYLIAASRSGYQPLVDNLRQQTGQPVELISQPQQLTEQLLAELKPRYLFFPHWSHRIPAWVYQSHECVIFHMTDLPFGRGGTPLQNLISRGIYRTQISALRCNEVIDGGPIYLKTPFSLEGNAEQIYQRGAELVTQMILEIIRTEPIPSPQQGEPVNFPRRTPAQSDLAPVQGLTAIYDHIRMLDAEGYPRAFLQQAGQRIEFSDARWVDGQLIATVTFQEQEPDD